MVKGNDLSRSSEFELPLVSIVLATYNGSRYVAQQIDSIVSQQYPRKEIVILDDCSNDGTWDILELKGKNCPIITLHRNKDNEGYIKTFERLLSLCNGDLIAFSDQDDVWMPNKISDLVSGLGDHTLIYHDSLLIDEYGKLIDNLRTSDMLGFISKPSNIPFMYNNCVPGHAMMFRKELVSKVLPIPEGIPYDHWIVYVALTIGRVKYMDSVLGCHRKHTDSLTYVSHYESEKLERLRQINRERISYLKALSTFVENSPRDKRVIHGLIEGLTWKEMYGFSFRLFFTLFKYRKELFSIYPSKSDLSYLLRIYKECRSLTYS